MARNTWIWRSPRTTKLAAADSHHLLGYVASAQGEYEQATDAVRGATAAGDGAWRPRTRWRRHGSSLDACGMGRATTSTPRPCWSRPSRCSVTSTIGGAWPSRSTASAWWTVCAGSEVSAADRLREALELWRAFANKENLAEWLAVVATLAATAQAPQCSARLFGAAEALRAEIGHAFVLPDAHFFGEAEQAIRVALGEGAFQAEHAAGRALPLDHALEEAVAFLSGAPEAPSTAAPEACRRRRSIPSPSPAASGKSSGCSAAPDRCGDRRTALPQPAHRQPSRLQCARQAGGANRREAVAMAARQGLV